MQAIRKGAELELTVDKLAFGGKGVAHVDGLVVFIEHAIPGQRVRVRITRKRRQFAEAHVVGIISQSPVYTEPFCPHFSYCGGCKWQDLPYSEQIRWKRLHVQECLVHLGGIKGEPADVQETYPAPQVQYYRNKMEFTFSPDRWLLPEEISRKEVRYSKSLALGLHVQGRFDKIFNVQTCFLQSPESVEILKEVRDWAMQSGMPAYSTIRHTGFWRFLVIREGKRTGQTLIHLLTAPHQHQDTVVNALTQHLLERFPQITTVVHSVSQKKAQVAVGDSSRIVIGPGYIEERLGELRFQISAHSFFQTNPVAAERLYQAVSELCSFSGTETVWDLYCGTGSIALFIASKVRRVVGFEVVEEAVEDAYRNCGLNNISNCSFRAGDLKDVIKEVRDSSTHGGKPDVVITDPPRAGMHPKVVQVLREVAPRRIISVSCNPATLARDLGLLLDLYEVKAVQPFDLFPHTPHIECVVRLDRRNLVE
jgi:23S rRNA (uracil1939-C5)-methyltransferase